MKLPFDFGIKLLFRLLIPGFILTLGLVPALNTVADWGGWTAKLDFGFWLVVILTGWLIIISDMPIYMLFEGRRFWPDRLRKFFLSREEGRLKRLQKTIDQFLNLEGKEPDDKEYIEAHRRYLEAYFDMRNFSMDDTGEYKAHAPSRFGNLLAAYEDYPERLYGMDAVFYWYRIWLKLDKDLRDEIDNQQAVADSAVYTAFALFCDGLLWFVYAAVSTLGLIAPRFPKIYAIIPTSKVTIIDHLPDIGISWLVFLMFVLLGYALYRTSIYFQAQYGELFKAMFDMYHKEVSVAEVMKEVSRLTNDPSFVTLPRKDQLDVAKRYLWYYRIICPKCNELLSPAQLEDHPCIRRNSKDGVLKGTLAEDY